MRVIAGKYRAKKLKEFEISSTRPTLDRVKEAIFSSIQFDCLGARVLDLFSGTGALGIEAISRGATETHFVDKDMRAIKLIKENTRGMVEEFKIFNEDYQTFLLKAKDKYDIILLDPPFASNYGENAINIILSRNLLSDNGVIVYEKSKEKPFVLTSDDYLVKEKVYGNVEVVLIRKNK